MLDTDYLVVGAGAAALSFIDTLLDTTDARILVVDRRDQPGGHWNDAYGFVRLHQPTEWYGVPSRSISRSLAGHAVNRADGETVRRYFHDLVQTRFLTSGRVEWMPGTRYVGGANGVHQLHSSRTGDTLELRVRKRVVDATLTRTEVPASTPPRYSVSPGIRVIAPNALPSLAGSFDHYTVVGGGKTAMDTCLWLLDSGVDADSIRWIVPRQSWLLNRDIMRSGPHHFAQSFSGLTSYYDALATRAPVHEQLASLERAGVLLRVDSGMEPTRIRGAVASIGEIERLRQIRNVVMLGHVRALEEDSIVLDDGVAAVRSNEIFVNCSASAAHTPSNIPVFEHDTIRLLTLVWGQPLLSASIIAVIESALTSDVEKNHVSTPVLTPVTVNDWLPMWQDTLSNTVRWRDFPQLQAWMRSCRLHVPSLLAKGVAPDNPELLQSRRRLGQAVAAAAEATGVVAPLR